MPRRALIALVLGMLILAVPATASKGVSTRRVGVHDMKPGIGVSFSYRDVFNETIRQRLYSGLSTRIVIQIALENEKGDTVGYWARTATIVYDLWEEKLVVTLVDPSGRRTARVDSIDQAVKMSAVLYRTPIARDNHPGKRRIRVLAEVNPVSEEMVRNIQSWISTPGKEARNPMGRNYFGSFVGYFVDRRIGQAEKEIRFVSQWFQP